MAVTIGSTTIGSQAITGNPPAAQRGRFMQIPRFRIRVLDPVSGAVVIDKLPHVGAQYETIFPQAGMSGVSAVGHFTIDLFHPLTDEYAWYKVLYDKLDYLQRVEFYLIDDPDGYGAAGDPVFTGILLNLPKEEQAFRVEGDDSLKLLELSRTLQADAIYARTDQLARYALKTYQLTKGDDWSGDLSAYTNDGSWALITDQGYLAVKAGYAGDGLLFTTTGTNAQYADCFVEAPFRVTCASTAGANADCSLLAAVADSNNFVMAEAQVRFVNPGRYEVDAQIWQKSGGVYTNKANVGSVIVESSNAGLITVTLKGVQTTATSYTWSVLLNEIDSNCTWVQGVALGSPTGGVGLRAVSGSATIVQHHLVWMSKSNAFQPGNIVAGKQTVYQPLPSMTNIDILQLAATSEGNLWRKRPKAGLNNDLIDVALSVGNDLGGIIRLEQDTHVVFFQTEANAEPFHTGVLASGQPGHDTVGLQRWYDISAMQKRGYISGPVALPHTSDPSALRQMAQNVLLRRKQPTQAKRLTVLRHEDHAELPNQPTTTGMAYRDGDWVTLHYPRNGINYSRAQVMSAKVVEGNPTMELTLDQYPIVTDREPSLDRLFSTVIASQAQAAEASQKDPNTGVSSNRRLVLPLNPWKMRVYQTAAQNYVDNTLQVVKYDTVDFDTSNSFSTTAWQFTAPVNGYYWLSAAIAVNMPARANSFQELIPEVFVNGVASKLGNTIMYEQGGIGIGQAMQATVSDTFFLNQGDLVQMQAYTLAQGGLAIPARTGSINTYWSMHLISA